MSIAPEILEAMKDAGASIDVILAAIRADQALADKAAEERRAKDRERQRRHRLSRPVTVTTRDACDTPPKDNIQTPPVFPTKPNGLEPPKAKPHIKIPLPACWKPDPIKVDGEAGKIISGWTAGRLERELSKFKDNALAGNVKHSDWNAAFRNWIKKADEFDERYGRSKQTTTPGLGKTSAAIAGLGDWNDERPM
jgi:hypothetical protein